MASLKELIPVVEKVSDTRGSFVGDLLQVPRISTGIFELDRSLGGGIPRGFMTEFYGAEGCGKTNLALLCIREAQRQDPKAFQVFIDVEGTWNPQWAARLGVDVKRVFVLRPLFAEQVSDAMQKFVTADDVNCIVLDSIAAMVPEKEAEEDSGKQFYGGATRQIKRMTQKVQVELNRRRNANMPAAAVIWINQIRANFDAGLYGNPEKTPGGNTPRFAYSLRLRLYASDVLDTAVSKTMPVMRETSIGVKKNKIPITAKAVKYKLVMMPYKDLMPGEVDSWHTIEAVLKANGALTKLPKDKGWRLDGVDYKVLKECRAKFRADHAFRMALQNSIIDKEVAASGFISDDDVGTEAELIDGETGEVLTL